ncbi:MAG: NfeD family protein [Bacteroidales bacterium]|nr:NfeD family protein [Bacteroidales bacterium]
MATWWGALTPAMKVLWGVTLAASLIFIIQTILTFIGADADATGLDGADMGGGMDAPDLSVDGDAAMGGTGSNLYTFRNLINFLMGFGWTAIILQEKIHSLPVLLIVATAVGAGLVALVMYLFSLLGKMQQSGNIDVYKSAVGCQGTSYLTIPAARGGEGKVQISIGGAVREYNAQTEEDTPIPTGTPIKVVDVINGITLLVERLDSTII